jgi:CHAT domain-containing protein
LDEKGKAVADLVWDPVAKKIALEGKSAVFISPDGPLHLMPLGALPVEGGGYLIQKVNLAYVSSGKDFLRTKKPSNRQGALLVGGVDFDMGLAPQMQVASATTGKQRGQCGKLNELMWNPLPGTAGEVNVIAASFQQQKAPITLLKAGEAQEAKVRSAMQSARYLHFATHGFFLGDECGFTEKGRDIGGVRPGMHEPAMMIGPEAQGPARKENPLLLSGLVLAGANNSWKGGAGGGDNDGYLLAMEVANMDLEGVELVTLSACKTGLGEIKRGEGVFGLKRSFMIAGAEGLVMSLWSVPDKETKELMTDFYGRILAKNPKRDSFRQSQLKMLKSGDKGGYHHPFYWAAFEYIGVN